MSLFRPLTVVGLGAGLGAGLAGINAVAMAAEADYYKGKTVTYVVATGAGGGYDYMGRLTSKYMQKYIPGSTFVVRNIPGAGHIIGTNFIYNSRPNGLTMGTFNTAMVYNQIVKAKGVKYDMAKMSYLGKSSSSPQVLMLSTKLPYKSFEEIKASGKVLKMATGGPGSGRWAVSKMAEMAFGLKFQMIPGYMGPDAFLAMQRGEIDIMAGSVDANDVMVKQGKGRFLVQFANTRDPDAKDTPTANELLSDPDMKQLAALVTVAQGEIHRITALPPKVPAARLAYLRDVYKKAHTDKGFNDEAKKADRPLNPLFGEDVDKAIQGVANPAPKVAALLNEAMNPKVKVEELHHTGPITELKNEGREMVLKHESGEVSAKISGSRTRITKGGQPAKRGDVKVGMTCTFVYLRPGAEAKEVNCK
jgi:tripartite-type tricarboxylate transporter receptor subunit TctC